MSRWRTILEILYNETLGASGRRKNVGMMLRRPCPRSFFFKYIRHFLSGAQSRRLGSLLRARTSSFVLHAPLVRRALLYWPFVSAYGRHGTTREWQRQQLLPVNIARAKNVRRSFDKLPARSLLTAVRHARQVSIFSFYCTGVVCLMACKTRFIEPSTMQISMPSRCEI